MARNVEVIEQGGVVVTSPRIYEAKIEGFDSMLFNKIPDLSIKAGKKTKKEDAITYEKEHWQEKAYVNDDGKLFIPSENLHECMKQGSSYWGQTIPGSGKKTYTDLIKSAVIVEDLVMDKTTNDLIEYGKIVNGTPNGRKPSKVYRIRPLLRPWGGSFKFHVFDARLEADVLRTILSYSGMYRGLGDWRPKFGRFKLIDLKIISGD